MSKVPEAAEKAEHLRRLREREAGREVFLRPLPLESTVDDVRQMVVNKCGEETVAIDRVKLLKTAGGTLMSAFVTLSSEDEARHCTAQLNGASFSGQVLAASLARNRGSMGKAKEICMFFLEGKCERGDTCHFSHEGSGGGGGAAGRRLPPCKFFAAGGCSRGQNCKFSHERQEGQENTEAEEYTTYQEVAETQLKESGSKLTKKPKKDQVIEEEQPKSKRKKKLEEKTPTKKTSKKVLELGDDSHVIPTSEPLSASKSAGKKRRLEVASTFESLEPRGEDSEAEEPLEPVKRRKAKLKEAAAKVSKKTAKAGKVVDELKEAVEDAEVLVVKKKAKKLKKRRTST